MACVFLMCSYKVANYSSFLQAARYQDYRAGQEGRCPSTGTTGISNDADAKFATLLTFTTMMTVQGHQRCVLAVLL